jgi:hypothetical protein
MATTFSEARKQCHGDVTRALVREVAYPRDREGDSLLDPVAGCPRAPAVAFLQAPVADSRLGPEEVFQLDQEEDCPQDQVVVYQRGQVAVYQPAPVEGSRLAPAVDCLQVPRLI